MIKDHKLSFPFKVQRSSDTKGSGCWIGESTITEIRLIKNKGRDEWVTGNISNSNGKKRYQSAELPDYILID